MRHAHLVSSEPSRTKQTIGLISLNCVKLFGGIYSLPRPGFQALAKGRGALRKQGLAIAGVSWGGNGAVSVNWLDREWDFSKSLCDADTPDWNELQAGALDL